MDQKTFKKISKEVFLDYGFLMRGKSYVLELSDVTIIVNYRTCRGIRSFDFYFFINALYDESVPFEDKYDTAVEIHMDHNTSEKGYKRHHLAFEEYSESDYRELLIGVIHLYFDPYKENALQHIKENALYLGLREKAEDFFGIKEELEKTRTERQKAYFAALQNKKY